VNTAEIGLAGDPVDFEPVLYIDFKKNREKYRETALSDPV
jgi:hypothetical protein